MKKYLAGMVFCIYLALSGCAPSGGLQPVPEPVVAPQPEAIPEASLAQRLDALPGGELQSIEGRPAVVYHVGKLFAHAAVLPLPGGTQVLEPLVEVLRAYPQQRWKVVVTAHTEYGRDYDRRLAQQRQVLVERYFKNRGVDLEKVDFVLDEESGIPLQVVAMEELQASSSEVEKE